MRLIQSCGVAAARDLEQPSAVAAGHAPSCTSPATRVFGTRRKIERHDRPAGIMVKAGQIEDALRSSEGYEHVAVLRLGLLRLALMFHWAAFSILTSDDDRSSSQRSTYSGGIWSSFL